MGAIVKFSDTASEVPSASALEVGELAVNSADSTMFFKTAAGTVINLFAGLLKAAGGTLTGNLTIAKSIPTLILNSSAAGQARRIFAQTAGVFRWELDFGDATAEGGSDTGSDISLNSFTDAGSYKATILTVLRSTGVFSFAQPVKIPSYTVSGLPAAASYAQCIVFVSNGTSNKRIAVSDGTNWRFPDGAIVS